MGKTAFVTTEDLDAACAKSGNLVFEGLKMEPRKATASLENVDDEQKSWHPGSNGRVLEFFHPSLFPLVHRLIPHLPGRGDQS